MDVGILILRVVLATILFCHATQKLAGWFHGPGLVRATALFEELGQRPAALMVRVAIACELVASALVLLGLATPLGAAVMAGTMLVAGSSAVVTARAFWNTAGGGEYPFVLAACAIALGFTGPGRFALDPALQVPWTSDAGGHSLLVGAAALVVAIAAAVPPVLRTLAATRGPDRV